MKRSPGVPKPWSTQKATAAFSLRRPRSTYSGVIDIASQCYLSMPTLKRIPIAPQLTNRECARDDMKTENDATGAMTRTRVAHPQGLVGIPS